MDARAWNVLSIATGSGMLDVGLSAALGFRTKTVCYVERESSAASHIVARMGNQTLDSAPEWDDIKTFDGKPWRGKVDIITGGYPCQSFSYAGKRTGKDDPRHIWPDIARVISEIQPRFCFFENVAGHVTLGFREIRQDLEDLGYGVTPGLFTAAEVGASHKRQRLFILAVAENTLRIGPRRRNKKDPPRNKRQVKTAGLRIGLGDSESNNERRLSNRKNREGESFRGPSGCLADAENTNRWSELQSKRANGNGFASEGQQMDDASKPGLQRSKRRKPHETKRRTGAHGPVAEFRMPFFAPRPNSQDWPKILSKHPEVEPAVCGVVDGLALGHSDSLRLTGNGVVPLQAAFAFVTLASVATAKELRQ